MVRQLLGLDATTTVLSTTELLENILAKLPTRDLLLAQRVCRCFRACIERSNRLQRLLFLAPSPVGTVSWLDWRFDDKDLYTTLALGEPLRTIRGSKRAGFRYVPHWGKTREDAGRYQVFINPLLSDRLPILSANNVIIGQTIAITRGMDRREASCWKMLITQPPIETMFIEWDRDGDPLRARDERGWCVHAVDRPPGIAGITARCMINVLRIAHGSCAWLDGSEHWKTWTGEESLHNIVLQKDDGDKAAEALTHLPVRGLTLGGAMI